MKRDEKVLVYDIETTGLKPWKDKVICIGLKDVRNDRTTVVMEDTEEETVTKFLQYCHSQGFDKVVGYNVSFDDRFIWAKALKYGIPCRRFFVDAYHEDLMSRMKTPVDMYSSNNPGSLDDWIYYLFGEEKSEDNGSVPRLYERGEVERIKDYCEKDVEVTWKLWDRIETVLRSDNRD